MAETTTYRVCKVCPYARHCRGTGDPDAPTYCFECIEDCGPQWSTIGLDPAPRSDACLTDLKSLVTANTSGVKELYPDSH